MPWAPAASRTASRSRVTTSGASPSDSSSASRRVGLRPSAHASAEHPLLAAGQQAAADVHAALQLGEQRQAGGGIDLRDVHVLAVDRLLNTVRPSGTNAMPASGPRWSGADVGGPAEAHLTGVERQLPDERQERRRLTGPVGAEQRDDLAGADADVDVADHRLTPVPGRDGSGVERATVTAAARRPGPRRSSCIMSSTGVDSGCGSSSSPR